jgi:hypothetical protein
MQQKRQSRPSCGHKSSSNNGDGLAHDKWLYVKKAKAEERILNKTVVKKSPTFSAKFCLKQY